MPKAGKLTAVDLDEISGVDEAANLVKGWVLMKQRDQGGTMSEEQIDQQVQAYLEAKYEEAEELAKSHATLRAALESSESYLVDAPDEVKTAAQTLWSYLKAMEESDAPKKKEEEKKTEKSIFARMFAGLLRKDAPKEEPVAKEAEAEEEVAEVETVSFDAFLSDVRKLAEKEDA